MIFIQSSGSGIKSFRKQKRRLTRLRRVVTRHLSGRLRLRVWKVPPKYHLMKTELVTTLKRRATRIISSLRRQKEPVLITQHGRPAAYLVAVATWERLRARLAVLELVAGKNGL